MNRANVYAVLVLIFIATANASAQCGGAEVTIPVSYSFKTSTFNVDWAFNSLQPTLKIDFHDVKPSTSAIANNVLEMTFCAMPSDIPQTLEFHFASRTESTKPRPIQNGKMAAILFTPMRDPDWIIVRNAQWKIDANGNPIVDVDVANYTDSDTPVPGPKLSLSFGNGAGLGFGASSSATIPVKLAMLGNKLSVTSPDVKDNIPIKRDVDIAARANEYAGNVNVTFLVCDVGALTKDENLHLTLKLGGPNHFYKMMSGGKLDLYNDIDFPLRSLHVSGSNAYPSMISIGRFPATR